MTVHSLNRPIFHLDPADDQWFYSCTCGWYSWVPGHQDEGKAEPRWQGESAWINHIVTFGIHWSERQPRTRSAKPADNKKEA